MYAHRVEGLVPGAYVLPRSEAGRLTMAQALQTGTDWQPVPTAPADLPLQCLAENTALAGALRTLSCHQAIGSDACFAVSLLAEFDDAVDRGAWHYRELLQEAGLIGQVLYLQAEAEGYRGTGIGCYFDDAVHELLGLKDSHLQVLYHFTVGQPVVDPRISTEPPYAHRPTLELPS
jgi:Nitroreductase family